MAIPVVIETEVYQGKSTRSANFGMEFSAKLARTLSTTLYDYKIEATIREYATNITDSHNDAGKHGVAGLIHLPTQMEPWYEAEDFGLGMTEDTIYNIFTIYGKSTKEGDNSTNGCLGYGSKAGFSVGDQFTVTSIKDGIKTVVVCYKDRAGIPTADTKSVTKTTEGNGTKIRVPVNSKDITTWQLNGARVLGAFETLHNVNTFGNYEDEYNATVSICKSVREQGSLYLGSKDVGMFSHRDTRFVLMGDVLYSIPSWKDLQRVSQFKEVSENMTSSGLYITHFPVGSLDFAPSRETISLDEHTFKLLSKRVTSDVIKYYRDLMKEVSDGESSSWYLFFKKFYKTSIWDTLSDYRLPFTGCATLGQTNVNYFNYGGGNTFVGNKMFFLGENFSGAACLVPPARKDRGGIVYCSSMKGIHQERLSRFKNVILVTCNEGGVKKKKTVLQIVADAFPESNTFILCEDNSTLDEAIKYFGVKPECIVKAEDYKPVKVKREKVKGTRGGYGITEDYFTVATILTENNDGTSCKVDLTQEGLYYIENADLVVKSLDGKSELSFSKSAVARRLHTLKDLGVEKVIVANMNNTGKIKRNGVPSLATKLNSLVKSNKNSLVKAYVCKDTNLRLNDKEALIICKVKEYNKFIKYISKQTIKPVVNTLLNFSNFGASSTDIAAKEYSKLREMRGGIISSITSIKERLPLWDNVSGDNFEYYLKLEKFIK